MNAALSARRDQATARHDSALSRWPHRNTPEFDSEIRAVIAELESVAKQAERESGDPAEVAKTWEFLGMAYYDAGAGFPIHGKPADWDALRLSVGAYQRAWRALPRGSERTPKLAFNNANALRSLAFEEGEPRRIEAEELYNQALAQFEGAEPALAQRVRDELAGLQRERALEQQKQMLQDSMGSIKRELSVLGEEAEGLGAEGGEAKRRLLQDRLADLKRAPSQQVGDVSDFAKAVFGHVAQSGHDVAEEIKESITGALSRLGEMAAGMGPEESTEAVTARSLLSLAREKLALDQAANRIAPERHKTVTRFFDEAEDWIGREPSHPQAMQAWVAEGRHLMAKIAPLLANPSTGVDVPPQTRAAHIAELWGALQQSVATESNAPMGDATRREAFRLILRGGESFTELQQTGEDRAATLRLERETLRVAAAEIRGFALRENFFVSLPRWGVPTRPALPNGVYVNAADDARELVHDVAKDLALDVVEPDAAQPADRSRWNAIASASISIFDIRETRTAEALAEACYELGIAQAIGKRVFTLATPSQPPVFDLTVPRAEVTSHGIREELDRALYGYPQAEINRDAFRKSTEWALSRILEHTDAGAAHTAARLAVESKDPIEARRAVTTTLGLYSSIPVYAHLSQWPPSYPNPDDRLCFHITPFGPTWAPRTRELIRAACSDIGVEYLRADDDPDPDVMVGIIDAIARSTDAVADLTGLTKNVAFELGVAHALGRDALIVIEMDEFTKRTWALFPMLERQRLHQYQLADEDADDHLSGIIRRFLARDL